MLRLFVFVRNKIVQVADGRREEFKLNSAALILSFTMLHVCVADLLPEQFPVCNYALVSTQTNIRYNFMERNEMLRKLYKILRKTISQWSRIVENINLLF